MSLLKEYFNAHSGYLYVCVLLHAIMFARSIVTVLVSGNLISWSVITQFAIVCRFCACQTGFCLTYMLSVKSYSDDECDTDTIGTRLNGR